MMKRLLSLLLTLAILLGAMPGLAETAVPVLRSAEIASLKALAGDAQTGATWHEGMSPSASMNALQMWQWTDWFLSEKLRSLLGSAQDYIQLASGLPDSSLSTLEWELRTREDQLTYYEEQLSDGRMAILNGIRLYQDVSASAYDRARAYDRMMEAKEEILQAIKTISANYSAYTALVARCNESMLAAPINHSMLAVQGSSAPDLMKEAKRLENSENAADAIDFDVTVISTKQICIAVYDSDKNPLSGALVHLVNNKDSKRTKDAVTEPDGRAVFWVSDLGADEKTDMKLGLRVTANGYQTHEIQTVKIRGGESVSVHLKKDDQTPYLVMACFNGRDILNEESSFYYSKKNNLKHTFSVKLSCAGSGELEMRYPTDAAGTAFQSVKQTFTAADSDKKGVHLRERMAAHPASGSQGFLQAHNERTGIYLRYPSQNRKGRRGRALLRPQRAVLLHQRLGRFWLYHSGRCSLYQRKYAFPFHPRQLSHAYDSALRHGHVLLGLRLRPGEHDLEDRRHAGSGAGDQGV